MDEPLVTRDNAAALGSFSQYRKTATTRISDFTVPPGTPFQTPEGLKADDEECRIAFDVQGGVYPIRESVFQASYLAAAPRSLDTPKAAPDDELKPHIYCPDAMTMGDCKVCGNVDDGSIRVSSVALHPAAPRSLDAEWAALNRIVDKARPIVAISFLRSVIASGEALTQADNEWLDALTGKLRERTV